MSAPGTAPTEAGAAPTSPDLYGWVVLNVKVSVLP